MSLFFFYISSVHVYIGISYIFMHHLLHFDLRPVVFSQLSSFINGVKDKTNRSSVFTAWRQLARCSTSSLHNSMVITSERWSFWHINCPVHSLAEHDYIHFFVADLDKHWFRSSTLHICICLGVLSVLTTSACRAIWAQGSSGPAKRVHTHACKSWAFTIPNIQMKCGKWW